MSEWTVRDLESDKVRTFESRSDAEARVDELEGLGMDVELVPPGETDGGEVQTPDVVEPETAEIKRGGIEQDPIEWMPSHFIDEIQGVPVISRKGYCVLAERYGIAVTSEPVTLPSETEFEYAEFQATATTADGQEYSGFGSAHVDRDDDPTLLAELAETRAMKRATAWATGVGMTAVSELQGGVDHA
jgi:hypothetical protein